MAVVNLLELNWIFDPGNSRADSPHANTDICQVVAEEKGGYANR
jgi:hypothetical protein